MKSNRIKSEAIGLSGKMINSQKRSVFENPKSQQKISLQIGEKEGRFTTLWRRRVRRFYASIIPSHISESQQLWLITPQEVVNFVERLRQPEYDVSSIEYVCILETIADIYDIMEFFSLLRKKLADHARIIYFNHNWKWFPIFKIAGLWGLCRKRAFGNLYHTSDLDCFADMSGLENVKKIPRYLLPFALPGIGKFFDSFLAKLPVCRAFTLITVFIARKAVDHSNQEHSVTVLIPCKNEENNVEAAIKRMPAFGKSLEILFINDKSTDRTEETILHCQNNFLEKNIQLAQGKGQGKGEAIRTGMKEATGDICMILDADLTVIPEDLPQFYDAMNLRRADFLYGTRLVYPQEEEAMRFANTVGNVGFSMIFSYILEQRVTDTLCGTKVFWRRDWPIFEETRWILDNYDLWGDYNLIFGAAYYGLKLGELPVRYFNRLEGMTKMEKRIKNGMIMLKVAWQALWKIKFH
ncbi:glycosyltransferase [candidate division KSB3 bacterium]|uniref:Glycosyltransferase n=1 Tax=candidate division KSB3 bacterium TaxID=2044937 RepID=A0A9D5JZT6_9BACT|nr:glycosyltransferase [candidate division KSB3 bacterium]MBD3327123.1 glycosyltransferase [candidate division KSB3 bacterium]